MGNKIFVKKVYGTNCLVPCDKDSEEIVKKIKVDKTYSLKYEKARNPLFHRMIFGIANMVVENAPEDSYWNNKTAKHFIKSVMLTYGFVEERLNLKTGDIMLEAKSIAFENMDDLEFKKLFEPLLKESARILGITEQEVLLNSGIRQ